MIKESKKRFKEYFSNKYLDWAEKLPKFQGGVVHDLQGIRETQRKLSIDDLSYRKKPENASITLKKISFVVTFQLEEFKIIERSVLKIFPNIEENSDFIKKFRKDESSISASSWANVGTVSCGKMVAIGRNHTIDKKIPKHVKMINISYNRITASIACLTFDFQIEPSFSDELTEKQRNSYLPGVVFKRVNPFTRFFGRYSMATGGGARKSVGKHTYDLAFSANSWLKNRIKLGGNEGFSKTVIEHYFVEGGPKEKNELSKWIESNRGWLNDYGISTSSNTSYRSANSIYCESKYQDSDTPVYALVNFECDESKKTKGLYEDPFPIISSMNSIVLNIRKGIESCRVSGFKSLNKKVLKRSNNIFELKRLGIILKRVIQETTGDKVIVFHYFMENVSNMKRNSFGQEYSLPDDSYRRWGSALNKIHSSYKIIDAGLTDYLEIQNIYAMYKLQKWMFILSIVVTIATIVGVTANWDNLTELWKTIKILSEEK